MEERKDNYNVPIGGRDMGMFNEFINDMEVDNVPLDGWSYTWFRSSTHSKSHLGGFLVSKDWIHQWLESTQYVLGRIFWDHCLIVLKNTCIDWGPKPFKVLNCWFLERNFKEKGEECGTLLRYMEGWPLSRKIN